VEAVMRQRYRVLLYIEMFHDDPDVEETVEASSPERAVVSAMERERVSYADWVRVEEPEPEAGVTCYLDAETRFGQLDYSATYTGRWN
jgi:hypothetical protein